MPLTTFDTSFDFTFARAVVGTTPSFPVVGGDGGGGVAGGVFPFATDTNSLASCLHAQLGQAWERWSGLPIGKTDYLLPFIVAVPLPDDLQFSPYCQDTGNFVDPDTGVDLGEWAGTLYRVTDGHTLYIINIGMTLKRANNLAFYLDDGVYRIKYGFTYSEPFAIKCTGCNLFRIRLLNDTRIGDLLYGSYGFQQIFYVEGELSGPTFDETSTSSGSEKTSGTVTKKWTLTLSGVVEQIVDALALAGLHKLVEVSILKGDGSISRSIQAMQYQAKMAITESDSGGHDVVLTLPVSATTWNANGSGAADCASPSGSGVLTAVLCDLDT